MLDLPGSSQRTVRVPLGERSYDIVIGPGLIDAAGEALAPLATGARAAIVTDETVAPLYLERLGASLSAAGIESEPVVVPAGERSKGWDTLQTVVGAILDAKLERGDLVIALGGGVVGDLAGFAGAIARRGMRFVQVPTSLLAQVDSSVGGKTGINATQGKNLIGAFHQPILVLADTETLDTLPQRELKAGYAEIVKYGLIDDAPFFEWLEHKGPEVLSGGPARIEAVAKSCAAKARIVGEDEREAGRRALLNLGHTFGHALEALAGYDASVLVHGEGVALGMVLAHRFSAFLGHASGQDAERVARHLEAVGLPTDIHSVPGLQVTPDAMLQAMAQDKKVERGALTFILTRKLGESFIAKGVPEERVRAFLSTVFDTPKTT